MVLYGVSAWTPLSTDAAALRVFERKVVRKIFGPVRVRDDFRIKHNDKLYVLLNNIDVVQCINIQRLRWFGHVVRIEEDAPRGRYRRFLSSSSSTFFELNQIEEDPSSSGVGAQEAEAPARVC